MFLFTLMFSIIASVGSIIAAYAAFHFQKENQSKLVPMLVAYATGTLLTTACVGLLPEAIHHIEESGSDPYPVFLTLLIAILGFFSLEKLIMWHHCHDEHCEERKKTGAMILVGDGFHNMVDGVLIAAGFLTSLELGIVISLSAIIHEIAQEIGDFAILLDSGYEKHRALLLNLLSSLTTVVASIIAYFALESFENVIPYVIAISAASFFYIALADLSPELNHQKHLKSSLQQFVFILIGIITVLILLSFHQH